VGYGQGMKPNRESPQGGGGDSLLEALVQPLRDLQDQYVRARALAERIESELGAVASRVLPGAGMARPAHAAPAGASRPPLARLQVRFPDQPALLAFEQQLSALEGVASVTVAGSTANECTLLVELLGDASAGYAPAAPTIVCTNCGRVLFEGSAEISHGLCPDCLREFGAR
jgi:hypothetical protein